MEQSRIRETRVALDEIQTIGKGRSTYMARTAAPVFYKITRDEAEKILQERLATLQSIPKA